MKSTYPKYIFSVLLVTACIQSCKIAKPYKQPDNVTTDPLEMRLRVGIGNETCAAIEALDQVTIGAVNGLAIGGAVVFLSSMDIRVATESAWMAIPEVDLNIPLPVPPLESSHGVR